MIELYHRQMCPFSKKVRDFIESNDLKSRVQYRDVAEKKEYMARLQDLTGREQVPCLVINGQPLLESDDIIAWLKLNMESMREPKTQAPLHH